MNKKELTAAVDSRKAETKAALQAVYDALNQGQRAKIKKNEAVAALLAFYGVEE